MKNIFNDLVREIEVCYVSNDRSRISKVLEKYVSTNAMPFLINEFLGNETVLSFISIHAYSHQNGFDKIMLYESPLSGWKMRLHIWWDEIPKEKSDYDIHNHAWSYFSYIVTGKIVQNIYSLDINSTHSYYNYSYCIDNYTLKSDLVYKGKQYLSLVESKEFREGDIYYLNHDLLHQVLPISKICATLVIHDKPFKHSTEVYKNEKTSITTTIGNNLQLSLDETKSRLLKLRDLL